jgi:dTDP-4-amino-4,6-dideoxygalactose transaminase
MKVPFYDMQALAARQRDELLAAAARVIDSGHFVLGGEVEAFEREFAEHAGAAHAVGVASGQDAVSLVLRAWCETGRLKAGDEVLVPGNTFIASFLAITEAGLKPVPVEPGENDFNIDVAKASLTERTRAVMPVHLYGQVAEMVAVDSFARSHGLLVLEDTAQAHGAVLDGRRAGTWGDAAGFSFYPGKNLGALGDGGLITTGDGDLAEVLRALRNSGALRKHRHDFTGPNSRLDEMQAAFLRTRLRRLDEDNRSRREIAARYRTEIVHPEIVTPMVRGPEESHVWHLFVIRAARRGALQAYLTERGIGTHIHYPVPPHRQAAFRGVLDGVSLPVTDQLANEVLSLPISPVMDDAQVDAVIAALNDWPG